MAEAAVGPRVSIVVPAYNAAATIEATLRSVLLQSFQDLEIVVVDDGSVDATSERVRGIPDRRIRLVQQENGGLSAARNAGIAVARGALIGLIDADDLWLPTWLEATQRALEQDPVAAMAYADAWVLDDPTWRVRRTHAMAQQHPPRQPFQDPERLFLELLRRNYVIMTALVRREILDELGGFNERLRRAEDYEFWLRLAANGYRLAHVPERLAIHREHSTSLSADFSRMVEAQITMYTLVAKTYDLDTELRAQVEQRAEDWRRFRAAQIDPAQRTLQDRLQGKARAVKRRVEDPRRWLATMPPAVAETLARADARQISIGALPARSLS